ncbi:MAG: hypothetical protein V3U57_02080 [Robiginitomaculum sp.]
MIKSKTIFMVVIGAVLALILWGVLLMMQRENNTGSQQSAHQKTSINALSIEHDIAPASVLSAAQVDTKIVITGLGVAGADISLLDRRNKVATTKVSGEGKWALSFVKDEQVETIKLDLLMATTDGQETMSDQSIFILSEQKPIVNVGEEAVIPKPLSLILLTAPGLNSRILQSHFEAFPHKDGLALETIDYDNSGGVIFSGTSDRLGKVSIYAGLNRIGESHVGSDGRWSLIFGNILQLGEYEITVELMPKDGGEIIRITVPFARMRPLFETEGSPKILVQFKENHIQMGHALHRGGYQYVVVYSSLALKEKL